MQNTPSLQSPKGYSGPQYTKMNCLKWNYFDIENMYFCELFEILLY